MLQVDDLSFAYNGVSVLENISLKIQEGEHIAIIGESGCGKSTLLKIIYGLLHVDTGEVHWNETQIMGPLYNLVPGESYMKYLAQDFDLMPYTTVEENIAQYLSVFTPEKSNARTQELLAMIEMADFAKTKIRNLSGGQQQRVALARVVAQEPKVLLLDEPFGHIDNFLKNSLRRNIFAYLKEHSITCITATHDHNDVLPFADRAFVLQGKEIIAEGTPLELYQHPKNLYIASLFGEANKISINLIKTYADTKRRIIVYAHEFKVSQNSGLSVKVIKSYSMGSHYLVQGFSEGEKIHFNSDKELESGTEVFLNISIETINQRLSP
ncbi:MAG: ABC transporter ATP-binding protein [Flavobacteriaceae bacterium]